MTHRAESIMTAVYSKINNLTTTGTRASRGRAYPADVLPALTLEMGADTVVLQNISFIDRELNFSITAHVKTTSQYDTVLNTIREEVHIALMADRTQGVTNVVLDTIPLGDDTPQLTGAIDQPTAQQILNWQIKYRHAVTNPGA